MPPRKDPHPKPVKKSGKKGGDGLTGLVTAAALLLGKEAFQEYLESQGKKHGKMTGGMASLQEAFVSSAGAGDVTIDTPPVATTAQEGGRRKKKRHGGASEEQIQEEQEGGRKRKGRKYTKKISGGMAALEEAFTSQVKIDPFTSGPTQGGTMSVQDNTVTTGGGKRKKVVKKAVKKKTRGGDGEDQQNQNQKLQDELQQDKDEQDQQQQEGGKKGKRVVRKPRRKQRGGEEQEQDQEQQQQGGTRHRKKKGGSSVALYSNQLQELTSALNDAYKAAA